MIRIRFSISLSLDDVDTWISEIKVTGIPIIKISLHRLVITAL